MTGISTGELTGEPVKILTGILTGKSTDILTGILTDILMEIMTGALASELISIFTDVLVGILASRPMAMRTWAPTILASITVHTPAYIVGSIHESIFQPVRQSICQPNATRHYGLRNVLHSQAFLF